MNVRVLIRSSGSHGKLSAMRSRGRPGDPRRHRLVRAVVRAVVALLVVVAVGSAALYLATPSVSDAPGRVAALAARDGASHLRAPVPHAFAESLVASEDARFYHEPGIDPVGIARAGWLTVRGGGTDPGGSTLAQQLAKQLYTGGRSNVRADVEQLALAVKLNLAYSKAAILRMYAATVYFGHGFYGLHNASCGYFARPPRALTLAQASLLAGLVQAPSAYDPLRHRRLAKDRQRYVLSRLAATGKVSADRAAQLSHEPLHLAPGGACSD